MESKFCQRLFERRNELDLSQLDIATRLGLCEGTVRHWESGRFVPSLHSAVALANVLKISLDYLVGRDQYVSKVTQEGGEDFKPKDIPVPLGPYRSTETSQ